MTPRTQSRLSSLRAADDVSLLAAVAAHWTEALQTIYERHADALYSLTVIVLDDARHAEAAVEETFLALWREGKAFGGGQDSLRGALAAELYIRCTRIRAGQERSPAQEAGVQCEGSWSVSRPLTELASPQRDLLALMILGGHTRTHAAREVGLTKQAAASTITSFLRSSPTAGEGGVLAP